ncbi:hypothetical protein BC937DRAFT_94826 [Endogone sp. FLAS-F59071]|nr:hypothetical protein BC937DRAFT_94826 [Endogone sp. FLAS-F59071]|eukprot:RUS13759.1 hypothetical protein BC937DRAFT_94826 [Endogone sp. FLAS-F59071]
MQKGFREILSLPANDMMLHIEFYRGFNTEIRGSIKAALILYSSHPLGTVYVWVICLGILGTFTLNIWVRWARWALLLGMLAILQPIIPL